SYMLNKDSGESLSSFLTDKVFIGNAGSKLAPLPEDVTGFETFMKSYHAGLTIERAAVDAL
ncbi:MAG: carbohydrate kinase, partial [Herbinix sp.]|nr:carbohydrate kinase [Herbinix sp.]